MVAWIAGVAFTVHGIAGSLDKNSVNQASKNMYKLGFLLSFAMGCFMYYVSSLIWKMPVYPEGREPADGMKFEYMAPSEGFFEDEDVDTIRQVFSGTSVDSLSEDGEKDVAFTSVNPKTEV